MKIVLVMVLGIVAAAFLLCYASDTAVGHLNTLGWGLFCLAAAWAVERAPWGSA